MCTFCDPIQPPIRGRMENVHNVHDVHTIFLSHVGAHVHIMPTPPTISFMHQIPEIFKRRKTSTPGRRYVSCLYVHFQTPNPKKLGTKPIPNIPTTRSYPTRFLTFRMARGTSGGSLYRCPSISTYDPPHVNNHRRCSIPSASPIP